MREIVLDTETTGFDPLRGDRLVEIGCIELINHIATEQRYHVYINPERPMPEEARAVHGLDDAFLADKPTFAEVVGGFLGFVRDSPLVIHNAKFDMGFINMELGRLGMAQLSMTRAVDTVAIARRRFPGAQVNLDALCRRYGIDNSARTLHGALLDAELLAEVYLELRGGRQPGLVLAAEVERDRAGAISVSDTVRPPRRHAPSAEEEAAHRAFVDKLTDPIWRRAD